MTHITYDPRAHDHQVRAIDAVTRGRLAAIEAQYQAAAIVPAQLLIAVCGVAAVIAWVLL